MRNGARSCRWSIWISLSTVVASSKSHHSETTHTGYEHSTDTLVEAASAIVAEVCNNKRKTKLLRKDWREVKKVAWVVSKSTSCG